MSQQFWSWPEHKVRRPDTRQRVSLPLDDWLEDDRRKCHEVTEQADLFDEPGSANHLALRTVNGMIYAYGRWLGYLASVAPHLLTLPAAERVTQEMIQEFCKALAETNSARGGASVLQKMRHVLLHLTPSSNWRWLHAIAKRIAASSPPQSKVASLRMRDELYQLGFDLMDGADVTVTENTRIRLQDALTYRDGLMIALLAADPVRRSNFAGLTIGHSILRTGSAWTIFLNGSDTKGGGPLEYPVPPRVGERLDRYLSRYRSMFQHSDTHTGLWASAKGCPMKGGVIYDAVCRRTIAAFGHRVHFHLFRDAAATFWSMECPEAILGARDLLGHRNLSTPDQHYRHAQTARAAKAYAQVIARKFGPVPGPRPLRLNSSHEK
jgi:integrase